MMKDLSVTAAFILLTMVSMAQNSKLPIKEYSAGSSLPFVFYISGDGGFNSFSTNLSTSINGSGYAVTSLNAKSYFWSKKTPQQATSDISGYIESVMLKRKNKQFILAGYSFGADVLPFIVNRLPDSLRKNLAGVVLLSPSTSTDFEIHLTELFGGGGKRSMDVVAEINKMGNQKTTIIFGGDEGSIPAKNIMLKNIVIETLPGGHHFDGNTAEVAQKIIKGF